MTATALALGLATAFCYGASDFLGGVASRRTGTTLPVVTLLKLTAVAAFLAGLTGSRGMPSFEVVVWAGIAGLAIGAGYIAYFRGLVVGRMGVVATITAVGSALVPVAAGIVLGDRPAPLAWVGTAFIVVAIILITDPGAGPDDSAAEPRDSADKETRTFLHCAGADLPADRAPARDRAWDVATQARTGVVEAIAAGIAFGTFFVALDRAGAVANGSGLIWPLLIATAIAAILVGAVAAVRRSDWRPVLSQGPIVALAGLLYGAGSWAFIAAVGNGWLSIVAVVAALSPAPTMILARLFLAESLRPRQVLGAGVALAGIALITATLPG